MMDREIIERSPVNSQRNWLIHSGKRKESLVKKNRLHLDVRGRQRGEKSFRDNLGGEMQERIWWVGRLFA